jgi:hypothetical protein
MGVLSIMKDGDSVSVKRRLRELRCQKERVLRTFPDNQTHKVWIDESVAEIDREIAECKEFLHEKKSDCSSCWPWRL